VTDQRPDSNLPAAQASPATAQKDPAPGQKAVPPAPMPRDKKGWRVAPAPDGRGMPDEHKPAPPHRWRGFWIFFAVLLALNWLSVLVFQPASQPRVKVPFSPYFLQELQGGKVKSISATSGAINGTFTTKVTYPANDKKAVPTTLFSTQVPSFWNTNSLTTLLQQEKVQVNANNPNKGESLVAELLLGFGPTLLIFGLIFWYARGRSR
jgi:cell division protease FtsH